MLLQEVHLLSDEYDTMVKELKELKEVNHNMDQFNKILMNIYKREGLHPLSKKVVMLLT